MGHYDKQIEQDKEDKAKFRREQFKIRVNNAMIDISTDDLEKLAILAEDWDSVVSVINTLRAISKK